MSDRLSPRARALVHGARGANDPTAADRDRVYAALGARLATGVVATGVVSAAAAGAHAATSTGVGTAMKLGVLLAVLGAGAIGTTLALQQDEVPAPAAEAVAAPPAPAVSAEPPAEAPVPQELPVPGPPRASAPRPIPDLSRRAAVSGDRTWYCASPAGSTTERTHEVRIVVSVRANGTPAAVEILADAGEGRFAKAATRCAMRRRYQPALDAAGSPVEGKTLPFTVQYTR